MRVRGGKAQRGFATEPGTFSGLSEGEATVAPLEGTTQGQVVNPYILDKIGLVAEPFHVEARDGWMVRVEGGRQARQLTELFAKSDPNANRRAEPHGHSGRKGDPGKGQIVPSLGSARLKHASLAAICNGPATQMELI
jgi:hypothetical protein